MASLRFRAALKSLIAPIVRASREKRKDLVPSHWGLQIGPNGHLAAGEVDLHALTERWGSPLHVVLGPKLAETVRQFQVPDSTGRSRCELFYSYKTNPVPGVLQTLNRLGVGAEVISDFELWLALKLGVPAEKIVYNGPAKSPASIAEAIRRGIAAINVNSEEELGVVAAVAAGLGMRARIGIRVASDLGWAGQFGIPIASGKAIRAFAEAARNPHLEVVGVHAHVGIQIRSRAFLEPFLGQVLELSDQLRQQLRLEPSIFNFGGSLAAPSVAPLPPGDQRLNRTFLSDLLPPDPAQTLSISDYVAQLQSRVLGHYAAANRPPPRIFLEPGRSLTSSTQLLLCRVVALKRSSSDLSYAIVDAGINHADTVRFEFHQLYSVNKSRQPHHQHYRIAGPICMPSDILYPAWRLPTLEVGDSLAIMDSGAYFVPFETSFSFPRSGVVLLEGGREVLLRRKEAFADMVARDCWGAEPLDASSALCA